jgi:hypothetical protein
MMQQSRHLAGDHLNGDSFVRAATAPCYDARLQRKHHVGRLMHQARPP